MDYTDVFDAVYDNLYYIRSRISKSRATDELVDGLQRCFEDAEEKQKIGVKVSKSMEEFLQIAYDLCDILNTYHWQKTHMNSFIQYITPFKDSKAHLNLFHEMEQINKKLMDSNQMSTKTLQLPIAGEIGESSSSGKQDVGDDLPSHLRARLVYLTMFPKEMDVPIRRLYHLLIADLRERISPGELDEYLAALENRGIVEVTRSDDGSAKRCRMRGDWYDIFSLKAQKVGLFYIHKKSAARPQFAVRRVVECADINDYPADDEFYVKHLRSYMSFNFQKKDMQALQVGKFVRKIIGKRGFALLTVLDLERVYKPQLPEELANLYYLKYLGLRWTFLDTLPSSLDNLKYLEILDVKHTYIRSLPTSNWWINRMRHLYMNQIILDGHIVILNFLETLSGLFVDKKSLVTNTLGNLKKLKKLSLTCHSSSTPELGKQISALKDLQSLKLRSIDDHEMAKPSSLHLVSLVSLENLTNLYLMGKLEIPSFEFPPSLRDLTLSVSMLEDDPMPILGKLPNLTVLRLLAHSYTGNKMVCKEGGFISLQVLKLWVLENLEEWVVEEGAMQSLKKLEVRGCVKLKSLPASLLNSSRLEELALKNMPTEFVEVAEAKRPKQTSM